MSESTERVGLAEAAHSLKLSWQQAWRLVLTGDLDGKKQGGRWMVTTASIDTYREKRVAQLVEASRR